MPSTRFTVVALALAAVTLTSLSACSSSARTSSNSASTSSTSSKSAATASSSTARPADVCALMSANEAGAILGETVSTYEADKISCSYTGEDVAIAATLSPESLSDWNANLQLDELDAGKMSPISGLGDQAAGNDKGLVFRKGSVIMSLEVNIGSERVTEDQLTAVAKTILGHLA